MSKFPFLTSPLTPPSSLPLISPLPATASSPSFTTRDFLFLFPPHGCTILRTHRHRFTSHSRAFHAQRLCDSITAFSAVPLSSLPPSSLSLLCLPPVDAFVPALSASSLRQRVDDLCDTLLITYPLLPTQELILTILFIPLPLHPSPPAHRSSSPSPSSRTPSSSPSPPPPLHPPTHWCLMAHPRTTPPFPPTLPLIAISLHAHSRLLPTRKHSQWIRDRQWLEQVKAGEEVGEVVMTEGDDVLEGLITNVGMAVRGGGGEGGGGEGGEGGGSVGARWAREGGRLQGYVEQLVKEAVKAEEGVEEEEKREGGGGLSVKAVKAGAASGLFITGSAVYIAGVQKVKWKEGDSKGERVMPDEGLKRVDRLREKLLATLDKHVEDDMRQQRSGSTTTTAT